MVLTSSFCIFNILLGTLVKGRTGRFLPLIDPIIGATLDASIMLLIMGALELMNILNTGKEGNKTERKVEKDNCSWELNEITF